VHQAKGGWLVAAAEGVNLADTAPVETAPEQQHAQRHAAPQGDAAPQAAQAEPTGPVQVIGTPAEGVSEMYRIISSAEVRKWPLYLRTVKQVLRSQTRRSTSARTDSRHWSICCARTKKARSVLSATASVIRVFQSGSAGLKPQAPAY
jgi:hypothetical protein